MFDNKISTLKWWLERGFYLLPVQPNSKQLVTGWGIYKQHVKTLDEAKTVFESKMPFANFAVMATKKRLILDFDEIAIYTHWVKDNPIFEKTYTEKTSRGVHVFFYCDYPAGLLLKRGVEIKSVCIIAPSVIGEKHYTRGDGEILQCDAESIFHELTQIGTRTVPAMKSYIFSGKLEYGLVAKIKSHWTVKQVLQTYHPEIVLHESKVVITCKCPFHDDRRPSFYILPVLDKWGCHACGVSGDVINLYARFEGIDNREAITRMSRSLGVAHD